MIVAIDVHYRDEVAKVVAIEFNQWSDQIPKNIHVEYLEEISEYIPGEFYKRELPCILSILNKIDLEQVELIIVDGYVQLGEQGKPGLGMHLYESLDQEIPIIGVAKRGFKVNDKYIVKIERRKSKNPLFVSVVGLDLKESANNIKQMSGAYRIPDLLKILDQKTKE